VHGAKRFSLVRTIIVEVISFFIVIFCLVTILRVITGIIQVSSRGNWCGNNWSVMSSWWRHLHCWRGRQSSRRSQLSIRVNFQDRSTLYLDEVVGVLLFLIHRLDRREKLRSKRLSPGHL
jgi:hypothetical protein